jgi:hypothetical protein
MVMRRIFPQPDLFETPPPRMVLAPASGRLIDQLRVLLMGDGDTARRRRHPGSMGGGR